MNGVCSRHSNLGTREFFISAALHACLVALVFFAAGLQKKAAPDLATISLDMQKPAITRPDKPGGDGRKAGSEGKDTKAAKGTLKTAFRTSPAPPKPAATAPAQAETVENAPVPLPAEPAPVGAIQEGFKGIGDGGGGGGGKGIGAYGSGSGFGGIGRDGMGGGAGRGAGTSKQAEVERYLREHYDYIRKMILSHLSYPPMAKKMGWDGKVSVSFTITESGRAVSLRVSKSCGYSILDENVVETIKQVQPFPKPPAPASINIPITYSLDHRG